MKQKKIKHSMYKAFLTLILAAFTLQAFADYPIVSYRYLADPGALVYNGRVYLYCSNDDENPVEGGYAMSSLVCVSSSDLKNWTDHGVVFQVPRDASWAGRSWAPSAVERNGKFYLYFGNGGSNIGVAVADSPTGPFTDPRGTALVNSETPGVLPAENLWLFDPMTFIDDDGQAYMYFGGNGEDNMRIIKLNEDMISVDGAATSFTVPYFFEAAWMHKHNDKYYFSYSTNPDNGMRIDYMIGDNPLTGFTYGGIVSPQPPDNNNNNHQAIFKLNGRWYQAYHNRTVATQAGIPTGYKRNLCIDSIHHNEDGSIETMVNTVDGVEQAGYLDPFVRVEAETMEDQDGIETRACSEGGMNVTNLEDGDWIKVRGVDFGATGPAAFTASVSSGLEPGRTSGSSIEIRIDGVEGTLIGTVPVSYTGGLDVWKTETVAIDEVTGVHDLYFIFKGDGNENILDFDYWQFTEKSVTPDLLAINAAVQTCVIDTESGSNTTDIAVTAVYADGSSADITGETNFATEEGTIVSLAGNQVTGLEYGTATITATFSGLTDSVKIAVKDIEGELTVESLYASESEIAVFPGSTMPVSVYAVFADGHEEEITATATYDNPHPEIATLVDGLVTGVSVGEVDITARFQGAAGGEQSTTIHVTVTEGEGIWLEAECADVGSLWNINEDANASHGEYITITPGNNSTDGAPEDEEGWVSFTFDISVSGTYYLYTRVICPTADDDSFWIRMDNGSFTMWNNLAPLGSWTWLEFPSTFTLGAGEHTLTIAYREDGARLDKIWITNQQSELTGEGSPGENCEDPVAVMENSGKIRCYPNPVEDVLIVSLSSAKADITIFNIDGKEVFRQNFMAEEVSIPMKEYSPGVYYVRIDQGDQVFSQKFIKI